MTLADFPRYPLTFGPSPVHRLERLGRHLGGPAIWAKREDCASGLAYGGNKTRKLEYLVPDALAQGATHLVSVGGVQSNHTRQVAAVAALNGPQDCVQAMRDLYRERRDVLVRGLNAAGWEVPSPAGSMFAWAPIPPRFAHLGSLEFSKLLLAGARVAVAPGIGFGEHGDSHATGATGHHGIPSDRSHNVSKCSPKRPDDCTSMLHKHAKRAHPPDGGSTQSDFS